MSYKQPNTGNAMNDYMTSLTSFVLLAPNLLNAKTDQTFLNWLNKLEAIDRRALLLYIKEHKQDIPLDRLKAAQRKFPKGDIL